MLAQADKCSSATPPPGCGCSGMSQVWRGGSFRRFYELPLVRNEHPALALSRTLYHVLDQESPLDGLDADDLGTSGVSLVVVSGYDVVAAQIVSSRPCQHFL